MNKESNIAIISYVPLLYPEVLGPGVLTPAEVSKRLENYNHGESSGCLWFSDEVDGKLEFSVCFVVPKAAEVVEHIYYWSEDQPEKWFDVRYDCEDSGEYTLSLIPKVQMSIDRYKMNYQLTYGFPMPKTAKMSVFFKSIYISSKREKLPITQTKMRIRLVDPKDVNIEEVEKTVTKSFEIGKFDLHVSKL